MFVSVRQGKRNSFRETHKVGRFAQMLLEERDALPGSLVPQDREKQPCVGALVRARPRAYTQPPHRREPGNA